MPVNLGHAIHQFLLFYCLIIIFNVPGMLILVVVQVAPETEAFCFTEAFEVMLAMQALPYVTLPHQASSSFLFFLKGEYFFLPSPFSKSARTRYYFSYFYSYYLDYEHGVLYTT